MSNYLIFKMNKKSYGIPLPKIRATLPACELQPLPHSDKRILGLLQLKDEIIPILELYSSLKLSFTELTPEHFFILVEDTVQSFGFVVNAIDDVKTIDDTDLTSTQKFNMKKLYIHDFIKVDQEILYLLNIREVKKIIKGKIEKE